MYRSVVLIVLEWMNGFNVPFDTWPVTKVATSSRVLRVLRVFRGQRWQRRRGVGIRHILSIKNHFTIFSLTSEAHAKQGGSNRPEQGTEPPPSTQPHFNHRIITECHFELGDESFHSINCTRITTRQRQRNTQKHNLRKQTSSSSP